MKSIRILLAFAFSALALPSPVFAAKDPAKTAGRGKGDPAQQAARKATNMALAVFDANEDGAVSGEEGTLLRSAFAAKKTGLFKPLDLNADGTLDDSEIAAVKVGKGAGKKKKNAV